MEQPNGALPMEPSATPQIPAEQKLSETAITHTPEASGTSAHVGHVRADLARCLHPCLLSLCRLQGTLGLIPKVEISLPVGFLFSGAHDAIA